MLLLRRSALPSGPVGLCRSVLCDYVLNDLPEVDLLYASTDAKFVSRVSM
jgi:hypothetical protein